MRWCAWFEFNGDVSVVGKFFREHDLMLIRVNACFNVLQSPPVVFTDVTPSVTKNLIFFGVGGVFDVTVFVITARASRDGIKRACAHVDEL